jgi:hypothetical protein
MIYQFKFILDVILTNLRQFIRLFNYEFVIFS